MKKIYFAFAALVCGLTTVNGQQTYENYIDVPGMQTPSISWSPIDNTFWTASVENDYLHVNHYSSNGTLLMRKNYYNSAHPYASCSIQALGNGELYIEGDISGTNMAWNYIQQIDINGNVLWMKMYQPLTQDLLYDHSKFKMLPNGELSIIQSVGNHLGYIHTDMLGNLISANAYSEDTTMSAKSPGFSADVYPDGSLIMSGKRGSDICLVKTDPAGAVLWTSLFGGGYSHTKDVIALDNGGAVACGYHSMSPFIMMVDSTGALSWFTGYGGSYVFYDVEQVNDSEFVTIGCDVNHTIVGRFDINGNEVSMIEMNNSPSTVVQGASIVTTTTGTVAFSNTYYNTVASISGNTIHIMENGAPLGCTMSPIQLPPANSSGDPAIAVGSYTQQPLAVTVTALTPLVTTEVPNEAEYCIITHTENQSMDYEITLLNNPATSENPLQLSLGSFTGEFTYGIYNVSGQHVAGSAQNYNSVPVEIGCSGLSPGVYLLVITLNDERITQRFVIR